MDNIKKITIFGGPGTGKSTLANNLGHTLNLPIYHLDSICHLDNWVRRDKSERNKMISFLVGVIEEKRENLLVIDVNGIGFELNVSNNTLVSLPYQGESAKIYTYMAVREDGVSLFGFSTIEERELFYKLITVNGVGPKMAISILSGLSR